MDAYILISAATIIVLLWRDIARSAELAELRAYRKRVATTVRTTRAEVRRALRVVHDALPLEAREELAEELRRWHDT